MFVSLAKELMQLNISARSFNLLDLCVDAGASLSGAVVILLLYAGHSRLGSRP